MDGIIAQNGQDFYWGQKEVDSWTQERKNVDKHKRKNEYENDYI